MVADLVLPRQGDGVGGDVDAEDAERWAGASERGVELEGDAAGAGADV